MRTSKFPIKLVAALLAVPTVGYKTVTAILKEAKKRRLSEDEIWKKAGEWLSDAQREQLQQFQRKWGVEQYWEWIKEQNVEVIPKWNFPKLLQQIDDCPLLLFARGSQECLKPQHVSIVGSRTPTRYGQWVTQKLVGEFVAKETAIVSGFMVGIDYQSHKSAITFGGKSIGVLGYGFGQVYPTHLERAAEEFLAEENLLLTEYPPGHQPSPGQFAARNRIVAGISAATIVVEAKQKSGSLITAQCALEAGRVVGAVPGPIDSVYSQGTHELLRQGAVLVSSAEDVIAQL